MAALNHEKELEKRRVEASQRLEEEERANERRMRQTTEELLDETSFLMEPPTPRTMRTMKRDEARRDGTYDYSLAAVLKSQNGSTTTTKWSNKVGGVWKKGSFNVNVLNVELDAAKEQHNIVEMIEIRGWVKSTAGRATRQYFTLQNLCIEEWETRVESITTQEWQKFLGHIIDVELVCTGRYGLRRNVEAVDGPSQSPSHRRTRTNRLEEQNAVVRDRNDATGDLSERLVTRWTCRAASCGFKGICFIDENGEHLKVPTIQRERWAIAIQNSEATEFQPPLKVYNVIKKKSGDDDKGRKMSTIEQFKEMCNQQMELEMMKNMRSMASESRQPQQSQQCYYSPPPPQQVYPYMMPQIPYGGYPQQQVVATPPQPSSPTPIPRTRHAPAEATTSLQRSSPIGSRSEEEDIMEGFWQWKKENTSKASRKLQLCQAQSKFEHEMWGLEDMKAMADTSTSIYKYAISGGLPDGLIRRLKADIKDFKRLWRETYQHAHTLNNLG